jgi:hypothetical protein
MDQNDPHVAGMTVNERLVHFGLMEELDAAVRTRQISSIIEVLLRAQLSEMQAHQTAKAIVATPKRYGF